MPREADPPVLLAYVKFVCAQTFWLRSCLRLIRSREGTNQNPNPSCLLPVAVRAALSELSKALAVRLSFIGGVG